MNKALIAAVILASSGIAFAAEPVEVWSKTYNTGFTEQGIDVAVDQAGNVFVAGDAQDPDNPLFWDIVELKYDSAGTLLFSKDYGDDETDHSTGITVDPSGNSYLCGYTYHGTDNDGFLIKHSPAGDSMWAIIQEIARFPGDENENNFGGVCADDSRIYVTGFYLGVESEILYTYIFDHDGNQLDYKTYDTDDDERGFDIAVDGAGNCCVAGYTGHDFLVISYDANLDTIWIRPHDAGNIDQGWGIALGPDDNIYTTGLSGQSSFTVCHSGTSGNVLWGREYKNADNTLGYDIAVDDQYYYIAGWGMNASPQHNTGFLACFDEGGNLVWEVSKDSAGFSGVEVDDQGYIYVTGFKEVSGTLDIFTAKYEVVEESISEPSSESSLTLEVTGNLSTTPTIYYSIPAGQHGTLTFYSTDGRKLESYNLDSARSEFTWLTDNPSGVYFAQLRASGKCVQTKIVLTK